jgi:hypothetical protein
VAFSANKLLVAPGLLLGKGMARRGVGHGGGGALHLRLLRAQAVIAVHGVHFAEHLTGLDGIAHLHRQAQQAPRRHRPQAVQLARLDRAHAKQGRAQRLRLHLHHRDGHRRQGPGTQGHIAQNEGQRHQHGQDGQSATAQRELAHGVPREMPRR